MKKFTLVMCALFLGASTIAYGDNVTVTDATDVADGTTTSIATLIANPGANGTISLREAMIAANNTVGKDTINFNLDVSDPNYQNANGGYWSIQFLKRSPRITDPIVIDGYSQTGAMPNTVCMPGLSDAVLKVEINGSQGIVRGFQLISISGCVIKGLVINNFSRSAISIEKQFSPDPTSNNIIQGNYIGTDISGTIAQPNGHGIKCGGMGNFIGGTMPADRNIISGNLNNGISVSGPQHAIQGNYIGVDVSGMTALGNGKDGISLSGNNDDCLIGGVTACSRNIISANGENGFTAPGYDWDYTNNTIIGNYIGVGADGNIPMGNSKNGIILYNIVKYNQIGGTDPGEGNIIANNGWAGINLRHDFIYIPGANTNSVGNTISGNSIYKNGKLGIDLDNLTYDEEPEGVTPNDNMDPDSNINNYQNFPILTNIILYNSTTHIEGYLNSVPNSTFTIEFFDNSTIDPSGYGEGEIYLGFVVVTTDGAGNAAISLDLPVVASRRISATATASDGSTSEFSPCFVLPIPLSNWAIIIGLLLIMVFTAVRYRRRFI